MEDSTLESERLFEEFMAISSRLHAEMVQCGLCIIGTIYPQSPYSSIAASMEYDLVWANQVKPNNRVLSFDEISKNSEAMNHLVSWAVEQALPEED